jgi:hypothetical protein
MDGLTEGEMQAVRDAIHALDAVWSMYPKILTRTLRPKERAPAGVLTPKLVRAALARVIRPRVVPPRVEPVVEYVLRGLLVNGLQFHEWEETPQRIVMTTALLRRDSAARVTPV